MGDQLVISVEIEFIQDLGAVRKAVIYHVDSSTPRLVYLPTRTRKLFSTDGTLSSYDLEIDVWFPDGASTTSVVTFPGTQCPLKNGYDILVNAQPPDHLNPNGKIQQSVNRTIRSMFSLDWHGNILIIKRGCRSNKTGIVTMSRPEVSLINTLLHR